MAPSSMPFAEGRNYRITSARHILTCEVFSVRDMTMEEGARCAVEKISILGRAAANKDFLGLLLNLRTAPKVVGPKTQEALRHMLLPWVSAKKNVSVVVADAIQELQQSRIASELGRSHVRVFIEISEAEAFVLSPRT